MCGGFFELFLVKHFGASCAEVKIAVCQEAVKGSGTDGKGEYESLSKGDDSTETESAKHGQVHQDGY